MQGAERGAQTHRETTAKQDGAKAQGADSSGDESLEPPRSHSLPNMTWQEASFDEFYEEEAGERRDGQWQYTLTRDFAAEIQNYHAQKQLRAQQKTKKKAKEEVKEKNMHERGKLPDENISLKICDLGNGCWTHHHFTQKIQTRQYRGPEVMLGLDYDVSADLWSMACMVFELITGDFLFDPRKGQNYSKTDDHLAQMIELLGPMPKNYAIGGAFFEKFFKRDPLTNKFVFKNIDKLRHFPLDKLLMSKYKFKRQEAQMLADFLLPILRWEPSSRPTAQEMLAHPWLSMPDEYNHKMSDLEHQKYQLLQSTELQEQEAEKQMNAKLGIIEFDDDFGLGELALDDSEIAEAD